MILRLFVILVLACAIFGAGWFAVHELYIKPEQLLHTDRALPPPTPPPDPSLADFTKCAELHRTGTKAESRAALEQFLREYPASTKRDGVFDMLGEINAAEFFAMKPTDENTYIVRSGDSLPRVAGRTKVPVELLTYLNKIDGRYLHPNQRLLARRPHSGSSSSKRRIASCFGMETNFSASIPPLNGPARASPSSARSRPDA